MKVNKFLSLALLCLILPLAALAAELPAGVSAMIKAKYPGYTVAAQAGGGNTDQGQLAMVLSKDGHNVLCIAEKATGDTAYAFNVETDTALRQGDDIPDLLIDSAGDVLFYTYHDPYYDYRYHAEKTRDGWGNVDITRISTEDRHEDMLSLQGDHLLIGKMILDENDNLLYRDVPMPLYTPWLTSAFRLQTFDIEAWNMDDYSDIYTKSAQSILGDGYTVSEAKAIPDALLAIAVDLQGGRYLFILQIQPDDSYSITQSTALPDGVIPDLFHSWSTVGIQVYPHADSQSGDVYYSFKHRADGRWTLFSVMSNNGIFSYLAFGLTYDLDIWLVGDYPAVELTTVDWSALPVSLAQAEKTLDQSGWARVISDKPENRLHLRTAPNTNAASLGKYYQGTPVRVLGQSGDWTEVDVFGVHGYMMTRWLAFGADMNNVEIATLWRTYKSDALAAGIPVFASPSDSAPFTTLTDAFIQPDPYIIGVIGDEWFHIVFPETGLSGYIRQDTLWPGNG